MRKAGVDYLTVHGTDARGLFYICRNNKWKGRDENTKNETGLLLEQTNMAAQQNALMYNPQAGFCQTE